MKKLRNLILVLGDQLDPNHPGVAAMDPERDAVWMAEVSEESSTVWSHKARIVLFLSAMRHFRDRLLSRGLTVHYTELDDADTSLSHQLSLDIQLLQPEELILVECGESRVEDALKQTACEHPLPLTLLHDPLSLCSREAFKTYAQGRKQLRMEYFYRDLRRQYDVLMEGDQPAGGVWNLDQENRHPLPRTGPVTSGNRPDCPPDALTREVMARVEERFPNHPGSLEHFAWPVTPEDAQAALDRFITHELPSFGRHQDAMWTGEPFLSHSLLASSLNLKLLNPLDVIQRAEAAWRKDPEHWPLASVEGFIRQILGWREYVRGIYWLHMPAYLEKNELEAKEPLPNFYWTAETDMVCLRETLGQTLEHGYAHHIQRLMVTGLFAMLYGVDPKAIHQWYLAVYVDAVEWVELPNTLGMSQYADGGIMASKPYAATGKYIQRMSNYCKGCRFNPSESTGEKACPFTTLYWDFLIRHRDRLQGNPRMSLQVRNLDRLTGEKQQELRVQATRYREEYRS